MSFRPSADSSGDVGQGGGHAAAGKDEPFQLRQVLIHAVDGCFKGTALLFVEGFEGRGRRRPGCGGQAGTDMKEIRLNLTDFGDAFVAFFQCCG